MALPALIDNTTPLGSDSPAFGDDHLRDLKNFIVSVFGIQNNVLYTGQAFSITPSGFVTIAQGTLTFTNASMHMGVVATDQSLLNMSAIWSNPGVVFSAIKLNVTDTASAPGSLLLDLRRNGVMQFGVRKDGWAQGLGMALTHPSTPLVFGTGTTGTVTTAPLTAARTWTFPDESGTVLLAGGVGGGQTVTGTWEGDLIAPVYGGTGLDTSTATGVPTVVGGVWSVPAVLPPSLGGTGSTAGAPSIPVPINQGGTAATTDRGARDNLNVYDTAEPLRMRDHLGTAHPILNTSATDGRIYLGSANGAWPIYFSASVFYFSNALSITANNQGISGRDAGNVQRDMMNIFTDSVLRLGDAALPAIRALTQFEAASTITMENAQWLRWKNNGGTATNLIRYDLGNVLRFSVDAAATFDQTTPVSMTGHLDFLTNNTGVRLRGVAAIYMGLRVNPSDVLELGDPLMASIQAMAALAAPSLTLTTPLDMVSGGVPPGGTTGQVLAKTSPANNDVTWVEPTSGPTGPGGPSGPQGAAGPGVAPGGSTGQVLTKASAADFDTVWAPGGGGGGGTVTDVLWTGPEAPADSTIELWADTDEVPVAAGGGLAVLDHSRPGITVTNTGVETDVYSVTIPGGTLGTNGVLRVNLLGRKIKNGGGIDSAMVMRAYYGATLIASMAVPVVAIDSATANPLMLTMLLGAAGATNAQIAQSTLVATTHATSGTATLVASGLAATVDSTVSQTLRVTWLQAPVTQHSYTSDVGMIEHTP